MGSDNDNFHQKRKAKKVSDLKRKGPTRNRIAKVLIVTEGSKTEPFYFTELKDFYEIDTANITISGECGSDPMSVISHGKKLYLDEINDDKEAFDRVFCVFDRDAPPNYANAIAHISTIKPSGVFTAITSTPCFEVWLILHFIYISKPFTASGGKSAGNKVLKELKKYWPKYEKGILGSFSHVNKDIDRAKKFAKKLFDESKRNGSINPLTDIHELVDFLENIKTTKL